MAKGQWQGLTHVCACVKNGSSSSCTASSPRIYYIAYARSPDPRSSREAALTPDQNGRITKNGLIRRHDDESTGD